MKILSNFKDYYDYSCSFHDDHMVYKRNLNGYQYRSSKNNGQILIFNKGLITKLNSIFKQFSFDIKKPELRASWIIIGEKIIPFITEKNKGHIFHYEYQSLDGKIKSFYKAQVKEHFSKSHLDLYNKIRAVSDIPIITYSSFEDNSSLRMLPGTNLNAKLKDLGLSKVLDGRVVLQEIELFLGVKNNVVEIDNNSKIKAAGFDKNSFRKS
jgi:hypothetical protein